MQVFVILHSASRGGIEKLHLSLAPRLRYRGFSMTYCCLVEHGPWAPLLRAAGATVLELSGASTLSPLSWFRNLRTINTLVQQFRRSRPDVLHTEMFYPGTLGRLAASMAGIERVFHGEHNIYPERGTFHVMVERFCARWTRKIVCPTGVIAYAVQVRLKLPNHRTAIIPNGVEAGLPEAITKSEPSDRPKGTVDKANDCIVAFCGRLVEQKNPALFLDAVIPLLARVPNLSIRIIGDGPLRETLRTKAASTGNVADRIVFCGAVDNPAPLLEEAALLVVPSSREGFSLVTGEAILQGTPALLADIPVLRESYGFLEDSCFVEGYLPSTWTSAIESSLTSLDELRQRTKKAAQEVKRLYDPELMADRYASLYRGD